MSQGQFSNEEDEQLRMLVGQHGRKWTIIGKELGRLPEVCRDRWRVICLGADRQRGESWLG